MGKAKRRARKAERADIRIGKAARRVGDAAPVRLAGKLSELADQPPLIALSALTLGAGMFARDRRLARAGARMLASHLLATGIKAALKARIVRSRPGTKGAENGHRMRRGKRDEGPHNSFPSGHSAGAVAVSRALVRDYPDAALAAYGATGAVAAVQVPRGAHFPLDVAAGLVIGLAAEWTVSRIVPLVEKAGEVLRPKREAGGPMPGVAVEARSFGGLPRSGAAAAG